MTTKISEESLIDIYDEYNEQISYNQGEKRMNTIEKFKFLNRWSDTEWTTTFGSIRSIREYYPVIYQFSEHPFNNKKIVMANSNYLR